jgi:polysaccharide biosynthesis/export protein
MVRNWHIHCKKIFCALFYIYHCIVLWRFSFLTQKEVRNTSLYRFIFILVFILLFCATTQQSQSIQDTKLIENEINNQAVEIPENNETNYRLGPSDVIKISIESIPEISNTYTISETGYVIFPTLLSQLKAQGLTVEQFQSVLIKALTEYMFEPIVTVSILEYRSHRVLVLGPFQRPGFFELKREKVLLLDVITEAGGLREIKENDELVILRNPSSQNLSANIPDNILSDPKVFMQTVRVNLKGLLRDGELSQNVMVQSGDVIYITSFFSNEQYVYVAGGGGKGAGAIPYEYGLTAFKALLRAGVVPNDPQVMDMLIIRGQTGGTGGDQFITTKLKFDPMNPSIGDVKLMPEDIVILPEASSLVVYVAGEASKPGALKYKEGLTVLQAILDAGGMNPKAIKTKVKILREDANGRTQIPVDMDAVLVKGDKQQNVTLLPGDIVVIPGMSLQDDIMVTGKVNTPGMVPYEEGITVVKAIFMAGGLSNNAINSQVRVMKRNGDINIPLLIDIRKAQSGETGTTNPILDPGDMMVVLGPAPGNIISVLGKVRRPGVIDYTEGLTVLQSILQAGGFEQGAARSKVKIVRGDGEKQQNISADLENLMDKGNRSRDIVVIPGDIIYVPETFF